MELNFNELRELLVTLDQTAITELTLKGADFELTVRKSSQAEAAIASLELSPTLTVPTPIAVTSPLPVISPTTKAAPPTELPVSPPPTATPPPIDKKLLEITSPMVGTFYRAPGPDERPFVEVGDRIRSGQTVCIIEAMKLMNELEAEVTGEVVEILVQNGQPVEFGQALMRVNPG